MKSLFVGGRLKGFAASITSILVVVFFGLLVSSSCNKALGYSMLPIFRRMSARSITTTAPLFLTTVNTTTSSSSIPSNQELVNQRLQVAQAKRDARKQSAQRVQERNLHYKRMLHNNTFEVPLLYAVKVSVCDELRKELRLNGRERRGRLFVEMDSLASRNI